MKGRSFAIVGWCLLGIWLLAGCAGNQMVSDSFDYTNRPQLLLPGANRAEVKGLAMGAARAKGWIIVQSTDEFMVIQRPLDPASPAATALGAAKSSVPPVIEVRSAFVEQSGGVNVALVASLITQPPGEKTPKRIDYTESYRDALTQSLASLRANWAANRQRVANAMPDPALATQPAPAAGTPAGDNPLVQAWGQTVAETPAAAPGTPAAAAAPPAPAPEPAPESRPAPGPALQWSSPTPAPVADGTGAVTAGYQSAPAPVPAPTQRTTIPTPPPTVVLRSPPAARPQVTTSKPATATAKSAAQTAKVEPKAAKGAKSDAKAAKPEAKVAKTDAKAAKPEPKTAKADAKAAKPESKTAKTDAKAAKPQVKVAKADPKAGKPQAKGAKPDAKPNTKQAKPDAKPLRAAKT